MRSLLPTLISLGLYCLETTALADQSYLNSPSVDEPCKYLDLLYPQDHLVAVIPAGPESWQVPTSPSDEDHYELGFVFLGRDGELCLYDYEKRNIKTFPVPLQDSSQVTVVSEPPRQPNFIPIDGATSSDGTLYILTDRHFYGGQYLIFQKRLSDDHWITGKAFDPEIPEKEYWRIQGIPDSVLARTFLSGPPYPCLPFGAAHIFSVGEDVLIEVRGDYFFRVARADSLYSEPERVDGFSGRLPFTWTRSGGGETICVRDGKEIEHRWEPNRRFQLSYGMDGQGHSFTGLLLNSSRNTIVKFDQSQTPCAVALVPLHHSEKHLQGGHNLLIWPDGTIIQCIADQDGFKVFAFRIGE